jgi:peptide/nickel transport system ATP-binding protein
MGEECYFADRCPKAMESCLHRIDEHEAESTVDDAAHHVRCVLADREYDESEALGPEAKQEVITDD